MKYDITEEQREGGQGYCEGGEEEREGGREEGGWLGREGGGRSPMGRPNTRYPKYAFLRLSFPIILTAKLV